jgi:predicted nucleotidyltransferase
MLGSRNVAMMVSSNVDFCPTCGLQELRKPSRERRAVQTVNALIIPTVYLSGTRRRDMDIYKRIAAKRDKILILADRFGIKNILIFGSVARHEARQGSDIDFLVKFPPGTSLLTHAAFQRELAELLGCEVDVASVNGIKEQIRHSVIQEAVPL